MHDLQKNLSFEEWLNQNTPSTDRHGLSWPKFYLSFPFGEYASQVMWRRYLSFCLGQKIMARREEEWVFHFETIHAIREAEAESKRQADEESRQRWAVYHEAHRKEIAVRREQITQTTKELLQTATLCRGFVATSVYINRGGTLYTEHFRLRYNDLNLLLIIQIPHSKSYAHTSWARHKFTNYEMLLARLRTSGLYTEDVRHLLQASINELVGKCIGKF